MDVLHDAVLHNISAGGALLEATLSQELRSARAATLRLPGSGPELTVRVCRVTAIESAPNRCLLGVEFIGLTNAQRQALASLTARNPRSSDAG